MAMKKELYEFNNEARFEEILQKAKKAEDVDVNLAKSLYTEMIVNGTNNWLPYFQVALYNADNFTVDSIPDKIEEFKKSAENIHKLMRIYEEEDNLNAALKHLFNAAMNIAKSYRDAADKYFESVDLQLKSKYTAKYTSHLHAVSSLLLWVGTLVYSAKSDKKIDSSTVALSLDAFKECNRIWKILSIWNSQQKAKYKELIDDNTEKIREFDSAYNPPVIKTGVSIMGILALVAALGLFGVAMYYCITSFM